MTIKWLTAGTEEQLIDKVNLVKTSGVKCIDLCEIPIIQTRLGNEVGKMYEVYFKGNMFQIARAKEIMGTFNK